MKKLYNYDVLNIFVLIAILIGCILIVNVKNDYTPIYPKVDRIPEVKKEIEIVEQKEPYMKTTIWQEEIIRAKEEEVIETPAPVEAPVSDVELMAKVVHAEAGNQDEIGKRLIASVILNRVDSPTFPNTIQAVCRQANQLSIGSTYTDADMQAVLDELENRTDYDVVWFRTKHYHTFGEQAFQHGDHFFSKENKE